MGVKFASDRSVSGVLGALSLWISRSRRLLCDGVCTDIPFRAAICNAGGASATGILLLLLGRVATGVWGEDEEEGSDPLKEECLSLIARMEPLLFRGRNGAATGTSR